VQEITSFFMDIQEQFYQKLMIFKISPWLKNSIFKEY